MQLGARARGISAVDIVPPVFDFRKLKRTDFFRFFGGGLHFFFFGIFLEFQFF